MRDEFVWDADWEFIFEDEWSERVSRIKKEKQIATRLLINRSKNELGAQKIYAKKAGLQYRFLPTHTMLTNFAQYTLGDMTATMSLERGNLIGILTFNNNIANNNKKIFDILWRISE